MQFLGRFINVKLLLCLIIDDFFKEFFLIVSPVLKLLFNLFCVLFKIFSNFLFFFLESNLPFSSLLHHFIYGFFFNFSSDLLLNLDDFTLEPLNKGFILCKLVKLLILCTLVFMLGHTDDDFG